MSRTSKIAIVLIGAVLAAVFAIVIIGQRFSGSPQGILEYSAGIKVEPGKKTVTEGEKFGLRIKLVNQGRLSWASTGPRPCFLSFHLLDDNGRSIRFDNRRFPLPHKIRPRQSGSVDAAIRAPLAKGDYILEFDLVHEGISWFKDYGSGTDSLFLTVEEKIWPEDAQPLSIDYGKYTRIESIVPQIDEVRKLIRLVLAENEIRFQGTEGKVFGFGGGSDYPQIWLRDSATVLPASRYFYPTPWLVSWLEEHLARQKEDGSLEDWIDAGGRMDKNTTETDQESSAVLAARQVFEILGKEWLENPLAGQSIIHRLERAMNSVLSGRFDPARGLITGAHTADWGDVDLVDAGEQAKYTDGRTHWTADIYDQSMFYSAALDLARMLDSLGENEKASLWKEKALNIKLSTDKWLWQEDKGFYKVHIHLGDLEHDFDENDIFAMGGNTLAVLSGLADPKKRQSILETALSRQESLGISTISGVLLPPYPKNVFKHAQLDDPYEYQNGAQWDWFGGRLVYALFQNGFSREAKKKLIEILRKNLDNGDFFEWDDREGTGRGNGSFCGSAGSLSMAIFQGYFGIDFGKDFLILEPKLGTDPARVHVYIPAVDLYVAYEYGYTPEEEKISMEYKSNFPGQGKIKVLIPEEMKAGSEKASEALRVFLDGREVPYEHFILHRDEFIVVETDFRRHKLKISRNRY